MSNSVANGVQADENNNEAAPSKVDTVWRLRSGLQLIPYGPDEVFVRHGSRSPMSRVVRDPDRRRVIEPLLAGLSDMPHSVDDLRGRVGGEIDDLGDLLEQLEAAGVVESVDPVSRLLRVTVIGDGAIAHQLESLLGEEFEITTLGGDSADLDEIQDLLADDELDTDLVVLAIDNYRPALELAANSAVAVGGHPLLRVTVDGDHCLVGPLIVPGQSACLNCLDIQDEASRHFRHDFIVYKDHADLEAISSDDGPTLLDTIAASTAASIAAAGLMAARDKRWGFLFERVVRVDLGRFDVTTDRLFALPRCPVCLRTRAELRHTFL